MENSLALDFGSEVTASANTPGLMSQADKEKNAIHKGVKILRLNHTALTNKGKDAEGNAIQISAANLRVKDFGAEGFKVCLKSGTRFVDIAGNGLPKDEKGNTLGWLGGKEPWSRELAAAAVMKMAEGLEDGIEPLYSRYVECWKSQLPKVINAA